MNKPTNQPTNQPTESGKAKLEQVPGDGISLI